MQARSFYFPTGLPEPTRKTGRLKVLSTPLHILVITRHTIECLEHSRILVFPHQPAPPALKAYGFDP